MQMPEAKGSIRDVVASLGPLVSDMRFHNGNSVASASAIILTRFDPSSNVFRMTFTALPSADTMLGLFCGWSSSYFPNPFLKKIKKIKK